MVQQDLHYMWCGWNIVSANINQYQPISFLKTNFNISYLWTGLVIYISRTFNVINHFTHYSLKGSSMFLDKITSWYCYVLFIDTPHPDFSIKILSKSIKLKMFHISSMQIQRIDVSVPERPKTEDFIKFLCLRGKCILDFKVDPICKFLLDAARGVVENAKNNLDKPKCF